MKRTIRVIVVNTDADVAPELRAALLAIDGIKIVAEVDEPALLPNAISQFPAEVLLLHLDPNPQAMMEIVAPAIEAHRDRIAAVAMTEDRDAELVMKAMRAGMREFLWKPFPPEQLGETLLRVGKDVATTRKQVGRILTVIGASGGVGATQLATNLAVELAQLESWSGAPREQVRPRVAVVDLDLRFGQVATHLDAQPTYTIAELCDTPEAIDPQMLERAMVQHASGVHVLARPADLATAEQIHGSQCASVLSAIAEHYDFIVADVPARFDSASRAVFDMTDTYLLVMQLVVPSVRNADRILHELSAAGYAPERVKLVCSRSGRDVGFLEPADVEATLNRKIDFHLPDEWKTSVTAVNMGAPLLTSAPKSKLRQAYQQIAVALAGTPDEAEETSQGNGTKAKKGLFSLFSGSKG